MNQCSGIIGGSCRHGFYVTPACNPWQTSDGKWMGGIPVCCSETLSARLFPDTGGPRSTAQKESK